MTDLLKTIQTKAQQILPLVSSAGKDKLRARLRQLEKAIPSIQASKPSTPLPALVMKTKGMPAPIDPFYFTLTNDPYAQ